MAFGGKWWVRKVRGDKWMRREQGDEMAPGRQHLPAAIVIKTCVACF